MRLDPSITVAQFLAALPSAVRALNELGIGSQGDETLASACTRAGVRVSDLEKALDHL